MNSIKTIKRRSAVSVFMAVQKALFFRELGMKLSVGRLGFFWLFFEPFAQVFFFILIRVEITKHNGNQANFDYAIFMAIGFVAFNMFKTILNSSKGAFQANKGLLNYKQVKPIDTILARVLLQLFVTTCILLIFIFIGFILNYDIKPQNLLMVIIGYLWLLIFSFGIGLLVGVGNSFFESIGKTVNILSFGLLIFSAVFYPLIKLPIIAQKILLYNPLVHFMEMIHSSYISTLDDRFVDYSYMFLWTIIPLFMGLWLYTKLQKKIISQ